MQTRLAKTALLAGATVPYLMLQGSQEPFSFYPEWTAFVCATPLVLSIKGRIPATSIWLMGLTGFLMVQPTLYPDRAILAACYIMFASLMFWAGRSLSGGVDILKRGYITMACILAISGWIQFFSINILGVTLSLTEGTPGMSGLLGQRNLFASVMAIAICWLVQGSDKRAINWFLVSFLAISMALSGSRMGLIYLAIIAIMNFNALVVLAIAQYSVIFFFPSSWMTVAFNATTVVHDGIRTGGDPRIHLLLDSLFIWWQNPIIGSGWGTLAYEMFQRADGYGLDRNGHNLIAHMLAETGVVGCSLLVGALWTAMRSVRVTVDNRSLCGIVLIMLAYSSVEFPLFYSQWLILFALILGMLNAKDC